MLIWMCALHCEAKPVIDFYRLKKFTPTTNYDLYSNADMACIVSGMGEGNMTAATLWANSQFDQAQHKSWINLGIAGHRHLPIGTTVLASTVFRANSNESYSIQSTIDHPFTTAAIISLDAENTDYHKHALYDMEAFAFIYNVKNLAAPEHYQVIKVISDNGETPPSRNKARISQLIADNMQALAEFARSLQNKTI